MQSELSVEEVIQQRSLKVKLHTSEFPLRLSSLFLPCPSPAAVHLIILLVHLPNKLALSNAANKTLNTKNVSKMLIVTSDMDHHEMARYHRVPKEFCQSQNGWNSNLVTTQSTFQEHFSMHHFVLAVIALLAAL